MSTNTFKLTAKVVRDAAIILSENLVCANLCNREIESQFAEKVGDSVDVKVIPDLGAADEFTGTTTAANLTETSTTVKLEKHFYKRIDLTSRELSLSVDDFALQVAGPSLLAIARSVDAFFLAKWAGSFARYLTGTAGNSPVTIAQLLAGRKAIIDNLAPYRNMAGIIDTTAETAFLQLNQFTSADYGPERPMAIREGALGKMHGAAFFTSQNALTSFNRGDIAGTVTVAGAGQTGTSINVTAFTAATGTVKEGTRLTAAGLTGTYTVVEDATIASNAATLKLDRAMNASPTNTGAVTFETAFKQNVLYNTRSVAGAVIAPAPLAGMDSFVQGYNGLSVRMSMDGALGSLSNSLVVDVFAGARAIYPKAGVVFQG